MNEIINNPVVANEANNSNSNNNMNNIINFSDSVKIAINESIHSVILST